MAENLLIEYPLYWVYVLPTGKLSEELSKQKQLSLITD
jgi:hypothetical protein